MKKNRTVLAKSVVVVKAVDAGPITLFGSTFSSLWLVGGVTLIKHEYGRLLN
jgi:hypothetical protein